METSVKIRNAKNWMKYNKEKVALILYGVMSLVMVLISVIALYEPVVPVCVILLMETGIVALLNKSKLWIHGIFMVTQLIVGILMNRTAIVILLTLCYVVGTVALMFVNKGEVKNGKR